MTRNLISGLEQKARGVLKTVGRLGIRVIDNGLDMLSPTFTGILTASTTASITYAVTGREDTSVIGGVVGYFSGVVSDHYLTR